MPAIEIENLSKSYKGVTAWIILALTGAVFFGMAVHCVEKAKD